MDTNSSRMLWQLFNIYTSVVIVYQTRKTDKSQRPQMKPLNHVSFNDVVDTAIDKFNGVITGLTDA